MKKTLKSILAIALTLIMALGSVSAFAASEKEDLLWDYYSEGVFEKYYYNGELSLGDNTVAAKDGETFNYFIFDADNAGYYVFEFDPEIIDLMVTPEYMENGRAIDIDWALTLTETDSYGEPLEVMLYMDKGENIVGAYFCGSESCNVNIDFIGETITDIEFEENAFQDLVIGADIYTFKNEKEHFIYLDAAVNFSSGKKIELTDYYFLFTTEKPVEAGNVEFKLEFFRYTNKYTVEACKITDFIKDIEFAGLDDVGHATVGYATSSCYVPSFDGFKVTYADGTSEIIESETGSSARITLSNDRTYPVFATPLFEKDGSVNLVIKVADHIYQKVPFEVTKLSFSEDLGYFGNKLERLISIHGAEIGGAFNTVRDNSFTVFDFIVNVYRLISVFLSEGGSLVKELAEGSVGFLKFHMQ